MNPKILHGNAYQLSRKIKDQSVQLIYTDPPFGTTNNPWDTKLNLPWFWEFAARILTPTGVVVLHSSQQFSFQVVPSNPDWFRYSYTWIKSTATGHLNAKKQPLRRHEELLVFYPSGRGLYLPQMAPGEPYSALSGKTSSPNWNAFKPVLTVHNGNRYPTTVLEFPIDRPSLHPTQKPLALAKQNEKAFARIINQLEKRRKSQSPKRKQ